MRPSAPGARGWGWRPAFVPSCWPPPFPQASAHGVPHCSQHQPGSAAGLPASARRLGASPALWTPQHRHPTRGMGSGDHSSLGPETLGRLLLLPSTSCWWLPASGHQGLGSLSNCQPHAIGTSRWAFPIPPQRQLLGSTSRPRLREGMGLCRPGGPSCPASTCFYCPPPWWQPRPRGLEGSCAPRAQESININHWGAGTFSPSQ